MTTEAQKPEEQIEVINQQVDDTTGQDHQVTPPPADATGPAEPPKPEIIEADPRAAIAARFKKVRVDKEPGIDATGDFNDPSQTYGQVAKTEEPQVDEQQPTQQEPPAPAKRKLKVNGQEKEYTDEEVIALAQKAAAGDDYLEQAKQRFNEARQVLETTRVHVSRQNPAEEPATPATETDDGTTGQQNPADPLKEAIEQIQYGDPDKAKEVLGKTIAEVATAAVKQVSWEDRVQADVNADLRAHDEFVKKNPELASDEIAHAVIKDQLLKGYADDLRKIGVPDDNIPSDPAKLANEHRRQKLQGASVRSVAQLLDNGAARYLERIGKPRQETAPTKPANPDRVQVNLNRDDRRRAIPQQPQRANVQPVPPAAQTSGGDARKAAVERAKQARGQL
jgi:hypothetical protein